MSHLLLSQSQTMQQLVQHAESIAASNAAVFLHGETGTGKNVLAEHLHRRSGRNGLFLHLDCAALSRGLLESELLGHEKGAFTGAIEQKNGYLDLGCGGTLFFDEVENLEEEIQIKLLSVLDTGQFWRVGGREAVTTEFRLISATNVDIQQRIESNKLRRDFYYRLKGMVDQLGSEEKAEEYFGQPLRKVKRTLRENIEANVYPRGELGVSKVCI